MVLWVTGFQCFPGYTHPGDCIPLHFPFLLLFLHPSSQTPPQQLCLGYQQLRPSSLFSLMAVLSVPAAAAPQCCLWSVGLCAALPSPLLLIHLPAASWDTSSWSKNLSWARKLRSSKSSERHLMIKYLIKTDMVPKSKRAAHAAYLILCCREIQLLV